MQLVIGSVLTVALVLLLIGVVWHQAVDQLRDLRMLPPAERAAVPSLRHTLSSCARVRSTTLSIRPYFIASSGDMK